MGTVTISLSDEVEKRFREVITRECGTNKGAISNAITEAIELWINETRQRSLADAGRKILAKKHDIGEWHYSHRKELYERT
jgi:predicted transcriptional regulator